MAETVVHVAADPLDATERERGYDAHIGARLLDRLDELFPLRGGAPDALALVCDENTDRLYSARALRSLSRLAPVTKVSFAGGEENKSIKTLEYILESLAAARLTRKSAVVALGGGIVGDVAGFAAASYQRGVRYIQVPTTLLAAVDSSVGGKTAINLGAGKNLAGAFWQPSAVVCDVETFSTLSPDLVGDGEAESLKHGVLRDRALFDAVASGRGLEPECVARNVEIKAAVVAADERESGARKLLNLGHTYGHAIEKCSNFAITHGHAVAIGTCMAARASAALGLLSESDRDAIIDGFARRALPTSTDLPPDALADAMLADKKRAGGFVDFVLPTSIGGATLRRTPVAELPEMLALAR